MSILENLVNGLFGSDDSAEAQAKPCTNCPSSCSIYPNACDECSQYKTQLIDQLYFVDHLEEHYAKYEVAGAGSQELYVGECPYCGATNPGSGSTCDYCGSVLREGSSKIRVSGASEIPDPIQLAQDIIFQRQELVKRYAEPESTGFLNTLINLVTGDDSDSFGSRMTTDEIKKAAEEYGVSVSAYLQGVDNGTYLTATAKAAADKAKAEQEKAAAAAAAATAAAGTAGYFAGRNQDYGRDNGRPKQPYGRPEPPQGHGFGGQNNRPQPPQPPQNSRPQQNSMFGSQNGRPQQPQQNTRPQQNSLFGSQSSKPQQPARPQQDSVFGSQSSKPQQPQQNTCPQQNSLFGSQSSKPQQPARPQQDSVFGSHSSKPQQPSQPTRPQQNSLFGGQNSKPQQPSRPTQPSRPSQQNGLKRPDQTSGKTKKGR